MGSHGIRDKVAIVGMGCTPFGEHWDKDVDDLLIDRPRRRSPPRASSRTTSTRSGSAPWAPAVSGLTLCRPLKIDYKPVTRLENMCATGSEAFRNACYAVASGAYDIVMAVGVEKLKDSGFSGLAGYRPPSDGTDAALTAPAMFSSSPPPTATSTASPRTSSRT